MGNNRKYNDYNTYLKDLYGQRVQKITVDAGLTCPNRDGSLSKAGCIYCNNRGSGSGFFLQGQSIEEQIDHGRRAMIRKYNAKLFLAYFQSYTNTYTSLENMKIMFDKALAYDDMVGLAIGTRPDCIDKEKVDLIESYAKNYLIWLEYGLQSAHEKTLDLINRGHDFKSFEDAVKLTQNKNINICAHIILGLPGENREMMLETARKISVLGINGVKIHLLYVVKDTYLATMYEKGEYICMEQNEYVETICEFIELLPKDVIIQRITGDPNKDELVAPDWSIRRNETFQMIQRQFEEKGMFQGKNFKEAL
ncbi:MAG: TIGR01212 family radical SAM protein [Desulfobacteraceae bacterium]|nr:TIGR01212 family radical SAM protein [Desulfobacteraceae bacterium]